MENPEFVEIFEKAFPFWKKLNKEDKETFCRSSHLMNFKKGTNIHDGNECTGVILIKKGSLRLYILSDEGKENNSVPPFRGRYVYALRLLRA